jgi:hypothetical protein
MPIQSAKRLVEQGEAHTAFQERASKSDALAFSARNQPATLSEISLQSIGQFFEKLPKFGLL